MRAVPSRRRKANSASQPERRTQSDPDRRLVVDEKQRAMQDPLSDFPTSHHLLQIRPNRAFSRFLQIDQTQNLVDDALPLAPRHAAKRALDEEILVFRQCGIR